MLDEFLTTNHAEIVARARAKIAARSAPRPTDEELDKGVPLFLDQLVDMLKRVTTTTAAIEKTAAKHGGDLLRMGFTIGQVVHDYGDVCQAVTELAAETQAEIPSGDFQMFNRCLDDAIAEAVSEYSRGRASSSGVEQVERTGALAHELRNKLAAATLAFMALKNGRVGINGSTGAVLERNLRGLRDLIDRSLTEVRIDSGLQNKERVSMPDLIEEISFDASLDSEAHKIEFSVGKVDPALAIQADRPILAAAITNLLQNAFKFSRAQGKVSLRVTSATGLVKIEVEDECGGLPAGKVAEIFEPFVQHSANRQGLGLGLAITKKGVASLGGTLAVRDLPGKGCIFTIELPRVP